MRLGTVGSRLGTPALTTRGMKEPEMMRIAGWIDQVLTAVDNAGVHTRLRGEIAEFGRAFPAPA